MTYYLIRFALLTSVLIMACNQHSNRNGNTKSDTNTVEVKTDKNIDQGKKNVDTQRRYNVYTFLADTILHGKLLDTGNKDKFDLYRYENDLIIQLAYVHYISSKKIIYLLTTYNRSNKKYCQVYDTATSPVESFADNAANYEEETLNGISYGVYEYFTKRNRIGTTIGVEPSRGKRLSVFST